MDPGVKKKTLRLLSNGVYILTSRAGDQFGAATLTWVSQASFQPPLLMAAIRRDSSVFRCMAESSVAALHIVATGQVQMAQKFFKPTRAEDGEINGEPFGEGETSAPILANASAWVECRVRQVIDQGGDHDIVILQVVNAACREPLEPLTIAQSPWEYGG
ncbi:MAG TPA: flavin reductase family protein [Bryobacteraceae bacterium]|nr:flavin reductase family protein [Bryobacteraceae bacterium]